MLRALLFLIVVVALALIVLSLLRRAPQERPRAASRADADADDDTGEPRALPPPGDRVNRSLSRSTTMHLLHELAFGSAAREGGAGGARQDRRWPSSSSLQATAADPKHAPRRPMLLPELVRAVNDSDTTRRELARMIAKRSRARRRVVEARE